MGSSVYKKQKNVLSHLLQKAKNTTFGRKHNFSSIESYVQFKRQVPPHSYDDIKASIEKLKNGASNIYWPGRVQNFAVSAGTSGEGKHLPLSTERLQSDRRFMHKVALSYFRQRPNILNLWGAHISMPGSLEQRGKLTLGEISGFSALNVPLWLRYFQLIDPQELTTYSFEQKFDRLLNKALDADLKMITAVPSWMLTLFQQALERTGTQSIAEVWPNLRLLVCGGVKLANYRSHLEKLASGLALDFIETYGASEGYIGYSDDLKKSDLKMVIENGLFFEAVPHPHPALPKAKLLKKSIPLWQIKKNVPYALLLSTNAGLWRYTLNDIVEFTSVEPPRFMVKGRVNDMLDDFGEALYMYEAAQALKEAAKELQIKVGTFSISPIMPQRGVPVHRWFVQFTSEISAKMLEHLSQKLDQKLQKVNRHYAIRRASGALEMPEIERITQTEINAWLKKNGHAHAQGKLPKILPKNTRSLV